jgi:hypothetical protein
MIRPWDLNLAAINLPITTQQQRIGDAISSYGIGEEDKRFDAHRWASARATIVQAEQSVYEKISELTSGTKDTMKSVHNSTSTIRQKV